MWLLATPAGETEPGLLETQEAAAELAGGAAALDGARGSSGSIGRRRACCGWQRVRANPASRCCGGPPRWSRSPAFFARPPRVKRRPAWETRDEADDSRDRVLDPRRLRQGGLPGLA